MEKWDMMSFWHKNKDIALNSTWLIGGPIYIYTLIKEKKWNIMSFWHKNNDRALNSTHWWSKMIYMYIYIH